LGCIEKKREFGFVITKTRDVTVLRHGATTALRGGGWGALRLKLKLHQLHQIDWLGLQSPSDRGVERKKREFGLPE
jgi:hypothetical protein